MPNHRKDKTGQTFGRLTIIARAARKTAGGSAIWICRCSCRNTTEVAAGHLMTGHTKSCGCMIAEAATTHGMSRTRTHITWSTMVQRCTNPKAPNYARYGGRGILVCASWLESFENFYRDMGERPEGKTLDRFPDKDGNYSADNCRWATPAEQSRNRAATLLTLDLAQEILGRFEHGESKASISRRMGVNLTTVYDVCRGTSWRELDRPWLHG